MRGVGRIGMGAALAGAVAATLGVTGSTVAVALQDGGSPDESLIDRLVAIEQQLPVLPPDTVAIDPTQTWATFTGDFTGARVALDTVADEARGLFVDAEESEGPVATAVADVARSVLTSRAALERLAMWETNDLTFPLDTFDQDEVATGADELYGVAQTGFALLLDARARALPAYAVLRDAEAADDTEKAVFDRQYQLGLEFDADTKPDLHRAMSYDTTQVMRSTSRFTSTSPGSDARARTLTVVCIDRQAYQAAEVIDAAGVAALVTTPAEDCPALDNGNTGTLVQR